MLVFHYFFFCNSQMTTNVYLGKVVAIVGTLFLFHSAFSTYERKVININVWMKSVLKTTYLLFLDLAYLKAVDQTESSLPIEVKISHEEKKCYVFESWLHCLVIDCLGMHRVGHCRSSGCHLLCWSFQEHSYGERNQKDVRPFGFEVWFLITFCLDIGRSIK